MEKRIKSSDVNKTFLSRPRRRLYSLSSRRLETKTLVSRTTSLIKRQIKPSTSRSQPC